MLKKGLFLFFILFSFEYSLMAQPKQTKEYYDKDFKRISKENAAYYRIVTRDDNGHAIGIVNDYYMSGAMQWEGYLDMNDQPDGPGVWYYENGQKQMESDNTHGYTIGYYRDYFPDGKLHAEGNYVHGKWQTEKQGNWTIYYENGKPEMKLHYTKHRDGGSVSEDVRDSINSVFYPNEKLLATGYYFDDCSSGVGTYYDTQGKKHLIFISGWKEDIVNMYGRIAGLPDFKQTMDEVSDSLKDFVKKFEALFPRQDVFECKEGKNVITDSSRSYKIEFMIKNDEIDGKYTVYSLKTGSVTAEANYNKGLRDGIWRNYDEHGNLFGETSYKNGKLDGAQKAYVGKERELEETNYKNGVREGISFYIEINQFNGKPEYLSEFAFKNGSPVIDYSCKTWYVDSVTFKRTQVQNEIRPLKNGKIEERSYYTNGKPEMVIQSDTFEAISPFMTNGTFIQYYLNGNRKSEGTRKKNNVVINNSWDSAGKPEVVNGNGVIKELKGYYAPCCNNCVTLTYYKSGVVVKAISKNDRGKTCYEEYKAIDNSDSIVILYHRNGNKQQESLTDNHKHCSKTSVWDTNGHIQQENDETDSITLWEHTDEQQKLKREWISRPLFKSITSYFSNGQKMYEEITKNSHTISQRQWDETGVLKVDTVYVYDEFGNLLDKKDIVK